MKSTICMGEGGHALFLNILESGNSFRAHKRERENEVENACAEVVGGYFCPRNEPHAAIGGRKNVNFLMWVTQIIVR